MLSTLILDFSKIMIQVLARMRKVYVKSPFVLIGRQFGFKAFISSINSNLAEHIKVTSQSFSPDLLTTRMFFFENVLVSLSASIFISV